jgi:hypothetical protein
MTISSNDYIIKILFLLSKWFQTRRFLWEFPLGSYVKLCSAVAAILVGDLKCRTQFWKRTTQESFQQSLVEIGSVVSEEKKFFKFHPPFFLFLAWRPSWLEIGITGHIFGSGPSKDLFHPPFFLICIIGQNRQKFKVHKKSRNIC